ncbi:MAG: glycosyltransferase family 4 protein [Gaiellaceae bacterium]
MKVLMTADTVGGVWTYALELADALAERDVEVSLVALGAPLDASKRAELRASRVARAYAEPCALEWMTDPWADVERTGEWLLEIAGDLQPDLVHVNGYAHAALPWEAPVVIVGHSCVLSWHEAVRGRPAGPEWSLYRTAVERGLASASLLVAPTHAMLDELVRLYEPPCRRTVVLNGRRRSHVSVAKEPFVLAAGRVWDEAKNVQALARAAPRLDWPVVVAGEGGTVGYVPRAELDRLLARAAIFSAPARYEPFGLAALEAGLAGCALVLGDIPSLREVWDAAALYVPPDDAEQLAHVLDRLTRDQGEVARLGTRARKRALELTPERMANGYLREYRRVLEPEQVAA